MERIGILILPEFRVYAAWIYFRLPENRVTAEL